MNIERKTNDTTMQLLAPVWSTFSPPENRTAHHKFLITRANDYARRHTVASEQVRILDTCLGDGGDAIALGKNGFLVSGNEVHEGMAWHAQRKIALEKLNISVTSHDWLDLKADQFDRAFDILLCVGNSFCYVFGARNQKKILINFASLLKPSGLFIIDERNFQTILDDSAHIITLIPQREIIVQQHDGMHAHLYGGKNIFPYPLRISNKKVVMGIWKMGEAHPMARWHFYPFKRKELLGLLKTVFGEYNVEMYSDYRKKYDYNAGFYQYVCRKS